MIPYFVLAVYLLLSLGLGFWSLGQREDTPTAFFLAGRNVGPVVLFFTLIATNFSAFTFLGFSGAGYRIGLSYYAMISTGTALVALSIYLIGDRAWTLAKRHNLITPAELIETQLGSRPLKLLFLAVMVVFTVPYLALQPIGAGYLLESLTNGQIPYFVGATGLTLVIVFYVSTGGMRSVALTDVLQGMLMVSFLLVAVVAIAGDLGGFATANQAVAALQPELFSRQGAGAFFSKPKWFSYMLLWMLSVPMFPQMFSRFYIPKTNHSLKISAILYPLVTAVLFICPVLIGVWGHLSFPGLEGRAADQILPLMLAKHTSVWTASLVTVAAIAAFMSTLDSQLLALSSMLTRDLYIPYVRPRASLTEQTWVGRGLTLLLALVGLALAYQPPDTIAAIAQQAFAGLAVLFPTTLVALYGKNGSAVSCIASILAGEALLAGFQFGWIPASWSFGFLPVVPVVGLAAVIAVAGMVKPILVR